MTMIPTGLQQALQQVFSERGYSDTLEIIDSVGGGCINQCVRLRAGKHDFFLKYNQHQLPGMFTIEAEGLEKLAAAGSIRIPKVYAQAEASGGIPAFLVLEWIYTQRSIDQNLLGEQLAYLHANNKAEQYGYDHDGYIGSNPQDNGWMADWIDFFREGRLRPQMEMAARAGLLNRQRRTRLEKLMENLPKWLAGVDHQPSLLHGDLWGGNVIAAAGGQPVLIDPAVYYGDREAEIAFTRLFGGFSHEFYQAYQSVSALKPGYQDRFQIYNLYHLLNHLNLFGEGYGSQIDDILRRFVG